MSHARQKIRDAVVTLVTGLTTTGSRVFDTRLIQFRTFRRFTRSSDLYQK